MEDEYKEIVRKFYEIYRPLQKKYNLRYHMHFSIYESEDDLIEIWEYSGETRGSALYGRKKRKTLIVIKGRSTN